MFRQSSPKRAGGGISWDWTLRPHCRIPKLKQDVAEHPWPNSVYDFDDYDQKIFQSISSGSCPGTEKHLLRGRTPHFNQPNKKPTLHPSAYHHRFFKRQNSEPEIHPGTSFLDFPWRNNGANTGTEGGWRENPNYKDNNGEEGEERRPGAQANAILGTTEPNPVPLPNPLEMSLPSPAITIPIPTKRMTALTTHLYSSSFGALNIESKYNTI